MFTTEVQETNILYVTDSYRQFLDNFSIRSKSSRLKYLIPHLFQGCHPVENIERNAYLYSVEAYRLRYMEMCYSIVTLRVC